MRVLIIEKDADARERIKTQLIDHCCEVITVADGASATELMKDRNLHLVLMEYDPNNPSCNLEVLKNIKNLNHKLFVVVMTDEGCEDSAAEALRHGASNYLTKPVHKTILQLLVDKFETTIECEKRRALVRDLIKSDQTRLHLPNDGRLVTPIVEHILDNVRETRPQLDTSGIHLGLEEIIRNAIEHGNLEIGFEEKGKALQNFALPELVEQRASDPRLKARRVIIDYRIEEGVLHCTVEDEGKGFDYAQYTDNWNPLSEEGLNQLNGRGIFLTKAFFDEVNYVGRGNIVELVKNLNACEMADMMG